MRIVVTGATSFIGRAVVEELLEKRHQVFAAVRPDSAGRGELEAMQRETGGQLTVLPVDLSACGTLDRPPGPGGTGGPVAPSGLGGLGERQPHES